MKQRVVELFNGWRVECDEDMDVWSPELVEGSMNPIGVYLLITTQVEEIEYLNGMLIFRFYDQRHDMIRTHAIDCNNDIRLTMNQGLSPIGGADRVVYRTSTQKGHITVDDGTKTVRVHLYPIQNI